MLDFYQWFPVSEGIEWALRMSALCGLIAMEWSTRRERREYEERSILIEHQQAALFAIFARGVAVEATILSFRVNGIYLYSDFVSWYNRYMGCARRTNNFFVFSD